MSFDLEKARENMYRMQIVRNWYDPRAMQEAWITLREAIEEIERLQADLEQSEIVIQAKMDCIDEQAMQLAAMKNVLVRERMLVLAFSPNEIMWREQNNMPSSFRSDEDWAPYEKAARQQLREEGVL